MHNLYLGETISRIGLIIVAIVLATVFVARAAERFPSFRPQLFMAVIWRMVVLAFFLLWVVPYYVNEKGGMDALKYHYEGLRISDSIRHGNWGIIKLGLGTKDTTILTALLYTPFGGDFYGFFAISAAFSLIAMLLQFEAFYIWYPGKHAKIYFALLAFFPSYAMWSGLAGKDSWIALGLGMASLGYSRSLVKVTVKSILLGGIGLGLITVVRPHIALMLVVALATASILKSAKSKRRGHNPVNSLVLRVAGVLLLLLPMILLIDRITSSYVGMDAAGSASVFKVGTNVAQGNAHGDSAVEAQTFSGPAGFLAYLPEGLTNVYLRPFVGEGHSANMILAGLENLLIAILLAGILFRRPSRFKSLSHPFGLFAVVMTIELSLLFCIFTNFGLISRERAQLLPFFFAIAAIVLPKKRKKRAQVGIIPTYSPLRHQGRYQASVATYRTTGAGSEVAANS